MRKSFLLLICLWSTAVVWANPIHERIEQVVQSAITDHRFSGAVYVVKGGEVLHKKAYGDSYEGQPNIVETKFLIGSVSKQFTAAAIALLHEEGKLNVQDKVSSILPVSDHWKDITIHQLLIHSAGVVRDIPQPDGDFEVFNTPEVLYEKIIAGPLMEGFKPGEKYSYSNAGYSVLAYIVETISKQSLEDFLVQRFFLPLNMINTRIDQGDGESVSDGHYVDKRDGKVHSIPYDRNYLSNFIGSGSVYSTVDDLLIWMNALKEKRMLKPSSWEMVLERYILTSGEDAYQSYYGYGWGRERFLGNDAVTHSGSLAGFFAMVDYLKEAEVISIILCNVQDRPFYLGKMSGNILKSFLQAP